MSKQLLCILLLGLFCWSCDGNYTNFITTSTSSSSSANIEVIVPTSFERNDSIDDMEILIVSSIINEETSTPISNAKVKIVGTDTPGNTGYSDLDGHCSILLPIIPDRNAESIMLVIEVQHANAVAQSLTKMSEDKQVYQLLGVKDPGNYMAAYVGTMNVGWNRLGNTLKCTIPIKMK